jgi:DNA modification methylase
MSYLEEHINKIINSDCFSGSGTTAIACHNLKRRFICIENDKEYYEASVKRLEEHKKQLNLF